MSSSSLPPLFFEIPCSFLTSCQPLAGLIFLYSFFFFFSIFFFLFRKGRHGQGLTDGRQSHQRLSGFDLQLLLDHVERPCFQSLSLLTFCTNCRTSRAAFSKHLPIGDCSWQRWCVCVCVTSPYERRTVFHIKQVDHLQASGVCRMTCDLGNWTHQQLLLLILCVFGLLRKYLSDASSPTPQCTF